MKSSRVSRINKIILGEQKISKIQRCRVLIVGAGGIGCQLLKNLSKTNFKKITILDLDSIQMTNLNRQFYFRKDHIGKSKAQIAKYSLLSLDSSLEIEAINDSIMNPKYNQKFYEQFDLVYSCLDSMKVRQYLASQTTKNNIPLIDAGTMSYFGQAYATIRFITNCHNCNSSDVKQHVAASCTIRSRPENPVHCATYAKNFYDSFFGGDLNESLGENLKIQNFIKQNIQQYNENDLKSIAINLFTQLFDEGIRDIDIQGNKIDLVRKLRYQNAKLMTQIVQNPQKSTYSPIQHQKQLISIYQQQKLWSISQYTQRFVSSFISLVRRFYKKQTPNKFDKDDDDCMILILTITNLRTFNFINYDSIYSKHKYLTYYQCKDLIGKVFPAIASTNAIAAALELRESINVLSKQFNKMRYISFSNQGDQRLSPAYQSKPNIDCDFCSQKIIYSQVLLNMDKVTFRQLQKFANENLLTLNRDISCGSKAIIRNSKGQTRNKDKPIGFLKDLNMINNGVLNLTFRSQPHQPPIIIYLAVFHKEDQQQIILKATKSKNELKNQLISYFKTMRRQQAQIHNYQVQIYGGYQL